MAPGPHDVNSVEVATVHAAILAVQGKHDDAARVSRDALAGAKAGSAGWMLPAEPLVYVTAHPDAWAETLAMLRERAI